MKNHFHLMICTPEANLSQAIQWLKVSYSMWFNAKYNRVGPLFQGRFKGVVVDSQESWLLELSLYIHLNPVRIKPLGLDKKEKKAEAWGWAAPFPEVAKQRLDALRAYRWSSYPFYAEYKRRIPDWLDMEPIQRRVDSPAAYRRLAENRIAQGSDKGFVACLKDRVALGSEGAKGLRHHHDWDTIIAAVEKVKGCKWTDFSSVRGDWSRAAIYYLARQYGGLTLTEIGAVAGRIKYPAISKMIKRFEQRMPSDANLKKSIQEIENLLNV